MFKIVDGRDYFYQWDLDRQIAIEDNSITELHFCNRTDDCSLVVDVEGGIANVPNIILTSSFDVRVFGYDGKATLHEKTFKVKPRTKPADYVYVETEARKFDELMAKAEEAVTYANEICEYVENNKLDFVDDGEGNVELKAINPEGGESADVDLSNYYTKEETDTRIEEAIEGIEAGEVDLSDYAKKEDIPTVPTNVSAFTNDAGYLTEHQSLNEYAKKTEIPTKTSQLTNDSDYVTKDELPEGVDTSNLLSKVDNDDQYMWYVTAANKYQVVQNYIPTEKMDADLDRVIGGKTLNNNAIAVREGLQLRVPATPTKDNHATSKSYVDNAIANIDIPDVSEYQTEAQVNALINQALGVIENGSY